MKSLLLVALSAATATATMALATDDASAAARRSGVNRADVNAGGINRYPGAVNRAGVNRVGIGYRPGLDGGNHVGWNDNWNNWNRPGWGVAATGLAIGATAASASASANYGSDDSRYYPTRAEYNRSHRYGFYYGPVCNPWTDRLCQ